MIAIFDGVPRLDDDGIAVLAAHDGLDGLQPALVLGVQDMERVMNDRPHNVRCPRADTPAQLGERTAQQPVARARQDRIGEHHQSLLALGGRIIEERGISSALFFGDAQRHVLLLAQPGEPDGRAVEGSLASSVRPAHRQKKREILRLCAGLHTPEPTRHPPRGAPLRMTAFF